MGRSQLDALLVHNAKAKQLIGVLRERLDDEHLLLLTALHELAIAQEEKDHQYFARRWLQQRRKTSDPVPVRRGGAQRQV